LSEFIDKLRQLTKGMTPGEVELLIGAPHNREDTVVPEGSVWGLQDGLAYKIAAGESVRQWVYSRENKDHCIWFALVDQQWKLSARLSLPSGFVS